MQNYIKIGALVCGGNGLCPLYASDNGSGIYEVFMHDTLGGAYYISNLSVSNVVELKPDVAVKLMETYDADGVALTVTDLYLFRGKEIHRVRTDDLSKVVEVLEYDTDVQVDDFEEDLTF